VSEQERNDEQQTEEQIEDMDVAEEQQDDVTGGRMRRGREDKRA
jgi:hypothetical protein